MYYSFSTIKELKDAEKYSNALSLSKMQINQLQKYSLNIFLNKPNSCVDPRTSRKMHQ